jgi:hypothetical protein
MEQQNLTHDQLMREQGGDDTRQVP